ncbi:hypothetical protein P872_17825 [Rhodonellum psychrophilum GCM71 = DSM 17998]|uniref:DUF3810 domain-containing protein n=2 Tax=Rhodonellum TaxID=336827 RepID=U5BY43_9BACT|nr:MULTISPECIES: DUF3810 domain-containing protein [Rhodonellum]ERM82484.1 hypothetical protein P872_17825 [Rhodonellum psychrophilum GCM71 = DSM 17998]SDY68750.1 Protein of unknown function [Rhodonellum ikkaensis]
MLKGNWTWTLLGLISLLIRYLTVQNPIKTEAIYSRTIFPGVRNLIDKTISQLPFATVYLFVASIFIFFGIFIYHFRKKQGWKNKLGHSIRSLFNYLGALVFFFLVLWGYNYQRIPIFQQIGMKPVPLNEEQLIREIELTRNILNQLRYNIEEDTVPIGQTMEYDDLEKLVRANMRENMFLLGLNFTGEPRTKQFYPAGFMRRMGILGIYFPFTGESYIDPSLHPLEKPFTIAHEMAHSYGVTDEGEANFIGWVICSNSDHPLLQYSGQLRLLRYQMNDLYRMSKELYTHFYKTLPRGIRNDLVSINETGQQYKPISLEISRKSNDIFLKAQGVKAGVNSYQQLPMLAFAWRNSLNE